MNTITPPFLSVGDTVAVISTARKVDRDFIESASGVIRSWGYEVKWGQNLFAENDQFAGTDDQRLSDLNDAIRDPEVSAIFCARGGYGTARLVDRMDLSALTAQPKWIIGYSDITALHSHIFRQTRIMSIHGSMPVNFASNTPEARESLRAQLSGKTETLSAPSHTLNRPGKAEGIMIGGNLSVLYSLIGSASQPICTDKILFLEDLDEYLYHVDRMMLSLKRSGMLANLAGIIIGGMTDMNDNTVPYGKTAEEIIAEHVAQYDFPVCFGFPSGHIDDNRAWIHGKKVKLVVKDNQLSLLNHC